MATSWAGAPKDPQDVRDYGINWAADIGDLTITASTWTVDNTSGVVIDDDDHTTNSTSVRLSGGTAGQTATLTNHITLSDGQELDASAVLKIKERIFK